MKRYVDEKICRLEVRLDKLIDTRRNENANIGEEFDVTFEGFNFPISTPEELEYLEKTLSNPDIRKQVVCKTFFYIAAPFKFLIVNLGIETEPVLWY